MKKDFHKIPVTVITGFLGAGKTTLVRHLLENNHGRRIALIINEFGDIGVDRELLRGCGTAGCQDGDIIELANGCLCCTVADEFMPVMEQLAGRAVPPDHIIIETSGLALPKPLVKAFHWPEIRSRVTVDGVVAVIDATAVESGRFEEATATAGPDHDNPLEEVFTDQLLCADMVLLNKADLLDETALTRVAAGLTQRLRAGVKIIVTQHGRIDPDVLLGQGMAAEDDVAARPSHHDAENGEHDHDDFESFALTLPVIGDPAVLEVRMVEAARRHDILRIKGFLDIPGKAMRHVVQGVGTRFHRYYDRLWSADEHRRSELVVIGLKGLDREGITATIAG
ncbi:MAG: cobalamin biosynthesis protein CobW [Alphaproteobacteria bacterium]|nr:cobalamin biosynthesis protein CobW [Alphaproteobacteria bacterium]